MLFMFNALTYKNMFSTQKEGPELIPRITYCFYTFILANIRLNSKRSHSFYTVLLKESGNFIRSDINIASVFQINTDLLERYAGMIDKFHQYKKCRFNADRPEYCFRLSNFMNLSLTHVNIFVN